MDKLSMLDLPCTRDMCDLTYKMWVKGWDEANGGNVSVLLAPEEATAIARYEGSDVRTYPMRNIPDNVRGRDFLVTATGSFFQYISSDPKDLLGVVHIPEEGSFYEIVAGFESGGRPTGEFESHLRSHAARLESNPDHHVIMHNHATAVLSMTHAGPEDEKEFTIALWRMISEAILLFPDGVGFLPWCVPCTEAMGIATAGKMRDHRIVVWQYHGVLTAGNDLRDAFGLLETVEKCAEAYMRSRACGSHNPGIDDEGLHALAEEFGVTPREGYLN
jgi:rhamnulose-1-phosphate aldolase